MSFVPSKVASSDLLRIAGSLNLLVDGAGGSNEGGRFADSPARGDPWPYRANGNSVYLPPIYVHFHRWFFLPARSLSLANDSSIQWLRITMAAETTTNEALHPLNPVDVTITKEPTYEWQADSDGTPDSEPGSGSEVIYHVYLLKLEGGVFTPQISNTPLITVTL